MIGVRSLLRPPHLIQALLAVPKRHSYGARRIRFTASAGVASDSESAHKRNVAELEIACPVCFQPLSSSGVTSLSPTLAAGSTFHCTTCQKQYKSNNGIFDLTISAPDYEDIVPFGVSFFQNPLIAFAYDRGYRDLFQILNFPGPDEECKLCRWDYAGLYLVVGSLFEMLGGLYQEVKKDQVHASLEEPPEFRNGNTK